MRPRREGRLARGAVLRPSRAPSAVREATRLCCSQVGDARAVAMPAASVCVEHVFHGFAQAGPLQSSSCRGEGA
eukprot:9445436-Lingulodinium_polyedra.AAC.1